MKRPRKILTVVFVLLFAVGCGERLPPRPDGMPEIIPCIVEVRFGGQAIEGVTVLFHPKDPNSRWAAGGTTDSNGNAVMRTAGYYVGVVPGEYIVSFRKINHIERSGMPVLLQPVIPLKYGVGQSEETITVTVGQSVYVFELEGIPDSQN